jgi:hypothetical protein
LPTNVSIKLVADREDLEGLPGASPLWESWQHRMPALNAGGLEVGGVLRPYFENLPVPLQKTLLNFFMRHRSVRGMADAEGITHEGMRKRLRTAIRALVREVALDDPQFAAEEAFLRSGARGRPARRYEAEQDAAIGVLNEQLAPTSPGPAAA